MARRGRPPARRGGSLKRAFGERRWISRWLLFEVVPLTADTYLTACRLHRRFGTSHWDSMILAAAQEGGCETLFSEDFNHGQSYDTVTVVNPFA